MAGLATIVVDLGRENPIVPLALLVSFSAYSVVRYYRSPWRKVPPGPKGWPILGNALELGGSKLWLKLTKWREVYGDVVFLNAAGQPIIVLNSPKAAADLLDRRASNYSNRPRNVVGSEMMTGGLFMVFKSYGDLWRRMRRATHEGLSKSASTVYQPAQVAESILLALGILETPSQWHPHIQRASASFTINLLYGSDSVAKKGENVESVALSDATDSRVAEINDFVARLTSALLPGSHLVEFFPWMKHIPAMFAKWKRVALASYKKDSVLFEKMMDPVTAGLARGDEPSSLMGRISKDHERYQLTNRENAWLAATMFAAGSETTAGVVTWWVQAMILYPEVQARAQAELDAVVGRDRIPTFADYEHMPYMRAMAKEALRWHPVDPLGLPHMSVADDIYEGHFIPANSLIIPNVWLLNQDPLVWGPDAMEFKPERHLDEKGQLKAVGPPDAREESHFTYGFGRRVCVGKHVANSSLFIEMAMILWAMNIERPKDANGNPAPMDLENCIEAGLVVGPMPFDIKVTPRFPEAATILEREKDVLKR